MPTSEQTKETNRSDSERLILRSRGKVSARQLSACVCDANLALKPTCVQLLSTFELLRRRRRQSSIKIEHRQQAVPSAPEQQLWSTLAKQTLHGTVNEEELLD